MYINVKMCNETKLFERAIDYLNKKKLFFADQTALYRLSKKRFSFFIAYGLTISNSP